ncbi:MAG TPA: rod shape-determining protein MreD [Spirochaetia bacterium]|nr:rod shape-determining protein MreD [Spirochaetia bacterium]
MSLSGFWPTTILVAVFVVLQSTLLKNLRLFDVKPDIALVIFLLTSSRQGSFKAQITGFGTGLVQDFLSLSPIGFNALIRTVLGYLYGALKGKLFIDPIFFPILIAVIGTLLKYLFSYILMLMFISPAAAATVFSAHLWIEMGINSFIAPFIFALLKIGRFIQMRERDEMFR